ncbi:MAG: alpha/beta fold hydrolase [Oscillospiraceae bacterium]
MSSTICKQEYIEIGSILHYFAIMEGEKDAPVVLFLHGGPGQTEAALGPVLEPFLQNKITLVFYDQRGAGRTFGKKPQAQPTLSLMLQDLHQIVDMFCQRYNKKRVVILGHSWGSMLGSLFVQKYPQQAACFIGVGQLVGMPEGVRVGYDKVQEKIEEASNKKDLKKLKQIDPTLQSCKNFSEVVVQVANLQKLQKKYGLAMKMSASLLKLYISSPLFGFKDMGYIMRSRHLNEKLLEEIFPINLREAAPSYERPVYYIEGDTDFQTPYPIAQQYLQDLTAPDKNWWTIENAGHAPMLDDPQAFTTALLQALQRYQQWETLAAKTKQALKK